MTLFPTVYLPEPLRGGDPALRDHVVAHGLVLVDAPQEADVLVTMVSADVSGSRREGAGVVVLLGTEPGAASALATPGVEVHPVLANPDPREIVPAEPAPSSAPPSRTCSRGRRRPRCPWSRP
ncbi:MAG TPA: hypothetical protein VIK12_09930 [Pengzhenrongella sp.]